MTSLRAYHRLLGRPLLMTLLGVIALVEVIFLAESFTSRMEQVVRAEGSALDVALLLVLKSPEILDLGLPAACLVAVYVAVRAARDRSELLILAGAGQAWSGLLKYLLVLGGIGAVISFVIAGFVTPLSEYGQRITLRQLQITHIARQIETPGPTGSVQSLAGYSLISTDATRGSDGAPDSVLIVRTGEDGPWSFGFTSNWRIARPTGPETPHQFVMTPLAAYGDMLLPQPEQEDRINITTVRRAAIEFDPADHIPVLDRAPEAGERPLMPLVRLFALSRAVSEAEPVDLSRVGDVLARALLVPAACLLALLAVGLSALPRGPLFALPAGFVLLGGFDIIGRGFLGLGAQAGAAEAAGGVALLVAFYVAVPLVMLWRQGERLIRPVRGAV